MAAASAALFVVATALLIGVVLWIVASTQRTALMQANDEDIATVMNGFRQEGLGEAKEILRQRIGDSSGATSASSQTYMRIQGRGASESLGNLPTLPENNGDIEVTLLPRSARILPGEVTQADPHIHITGRGVRLDDGHYLFVGRGTAVLAETRRRILQASLWVMLGSIIVAVAGGNLLARRLIGRVDAVAQTCEGIIAGRLNERVATAGTDVEWDRLARAINEMLNRISSLLENLQQVSSDIAHDLRTPLTRMRHRLENARRAPLAAPDYLRAIDQAIADSDQLLALFSALLRISQIESGTRAGSFRPVELDSMLENLCALYRPVAEDSLHSLELAPALGTTILGDPELLFQMLSNLVENALRHTPQGSRIWVRLSQAQGSSLIEVADNGPGIPVAELDKVTRRFYRVEGSRSTPGHGLGLALVNAIAQLHGAKLLLRNATPGLVAAVEFSPKSRAPPTAVQATVPLGTGDCGIRR